MPTAINDSQLRSILQKPLQDATDYVVQKIWNENKEIVRVVVYEAYSPELYNRSGEFRDAWNYTTGDHNVLSGQVATSEFYYNPESMSMGSPYPGGHDYAQHIGIAGKYKNVDARKYLADIIYQGLSGSVFGSGPWTKKRDAWKELNKRIGKRKMKQWMKEGMEMAGLNVQMHNAAISVTEN